MEFGKLIKLGVRSLGNSDVREYNTSNMYYYHIVSYEEIKFLI